MRSIHQGVKKDFTEGITSSNSVSKKRMEIQLPETLLNSVDKLAEEKYNSRSELVREALREKVREK